ncbi:uncharacterized protein METZ01_LOCUS326137, partial [marine metagenome]
VPPAGTDYCSGFILSGPVFSATWGCPRTSSSGTYVEAMVPCGELYIRYGELAHKSRWDNVGHEFTQESRIIIPED